MDKRNQMENPFFDPDKPGSIFVGMDRYCNLNLRNMLNKYRKMLPYLHRL